MTSYHHSQPATAYAVGTKKPGFHPAFTIVELIIVIIVVAMLAAMTVFAFGSWRSRTATTEVTNALSSAASAMKNELTFKNVYPTAVPTSYSGNSGVTVTYVSGNTTSYCIEGVSKAVPTIKMFVSSTNTAPQYGTCAGGVIVPGTWAASKPTGTSSLVLYGCTSGCNAYLVGSLNKIDTNFATGASARVTYSFGCSSLVSDCVGTTITLTTTGPLQVGWTPTGPWSSTISLVGYSGGGGTFYVMVPNGDTSPAGTIATFGVTSASNPTRPALQVQTNILSNKVIFTKN